MDLLCVAAVNSGYVLIGGTPPSTTDIARLVGEPAEVVSDLLSELEKKGVFSRDRKGRIYCRRMIKAEKNRKNGRLAGPDKLLNLKQYQNPLGESSEPHKPYANSQIPEVRTNGSKNHRSRPTCLPESWKPTEKNIADAKTLGLTDRDIARTAPEFVNYWVGEGKAKKDWDAVWRNRCITVGERLGRTPHGHHAGTNGYTMTRTDWERVFKIYGSTSNWPGPGPEPGRPGCLAPKDLCGETLL
jgi:hypothetical protein